MKTWTKILLAVFCFFCGVSVIMAPSLPLPPDSFAYQYLMSEVRVVNTILIISPFAFVIVVAYFKFQEMIE